VIIGLAPGNAFKDCRKNLPQILFRPVEAMELERQGIPGGSRTRNDVLDLFQVTIQ
jgi:hypothetical protein